MHVSCRNLAHGSVPIRWAAGGIRPWRRPLQSELCTTCGFVLTLGVLTVPQSTCHAACLHACMLYPSAPKHARLWKCLVQKITRMPCLRMLALQDMDNPGWAAWKSIAVCYSEDQGRTWTKPSLIITSPVQRPDKPQFGGSSDFSVVKVGSTLIQVLGSTVRSALCFTI